MANVYFYAAVVGGTLLVLQTLLLIFGGVGHDMDTGADGHFGDLHDGGLDHGGVDHGHAHAAFLKLLSLKAVVGFATFFGLTGLGGSAAGWTPTGTLAAALAAGLVALYLLAWMMSALHRLQSSGSLNLKNAVGKQAKVYLRVPGGRRGTGRVTLAVQGRMVECKAVTGGAEIPTGAPVRVVAFETAGTLAVEPWTAS
jgi:membrane protein implicated in regulation of membrane protease activity